MLFVIRWFLLALSVLFIAWLLPGMYISGFISALILIVVIALINTLLLPLIFFLTLPLNILTFGAFSLIINAVLFMLAVYFVSGVEIANFWWALLGSLLLSILGLGIDFLTNRDNI